MFPRIPLLVGFAALALVVPSVGSADGAACDGSDSLNVDAAGLAYVAYDDPFGEKAYFSLWVYAESNGQPGLQRGGTTLFGDLDICQGPNPDTGVF